MSAYATSTGDREPAAVDVPPSGGTPSDVRLAPPPGVRFAYGGGSRPLSGYTIKRGIGRGGFGEVYYAVSDSGKEVALKLIRRGFDVELRGVAQCLNLKHPNLLALYDIRSGGHDERWVVMEYAVGPSLEQVIAEHPDGLPLSEAVAWLRGIAAGVGYLHDCGLVHRDLKPGNIFCDGGLAKIGDYGLSKFISCSRRSGQTGSVGTVHYMAPEIASGRYGKEIDIYALGILFYEMLTGRVPFEGESVGEVLMKHLTAAPDLEGIGEPFRSIIARALAKDPHERFASVAEFMAALPALPGGTARVHDLPAVMGSPAGDAAPRAEITLGQAAAEQNPVPAELARIGSQQPLVNERPQMLAGEPVLRLVRQALARFAAAWRLHFPTPVKIALILAALWLVTTLGWALLPAGMLVLGSYGLYLAVWSIGRWSADHSRQPAAAVEGPALRVVQSLAMPPRADAIRPATAVNAGSAVAAHRRWPQKPLAVRIVKSKRERLAELAGSLVLSAIVALVITVVMILLRGETPLPEQFAWLALVSIVGAWGVLVPAKLWEGTHGEPALRRFTMLIVGLGVGVAAWGLERAFWVPLPHEFSAPPVFESVGKQAAGRGVVAATDAGVTHSLMTYMTYFGFLFLMIRWWRLADPFRGSRLSLWTTAVCVTWALALYMFWPLQQRWEFFPQPWGFLVAATIAIAVQLASPWRRFVRFAY